MNIRQEIWTPATHWKTALSHGDLRQPGLVFCFGNPGQHNAQAIFNEVKHSFPGADLVFGFLDNSHEEKLFLTAFNCDEDNFMIDKINLTKVDEDVETIGDRCVEKKWQQVLLSIDADKAYGTKVVNGLSQSFDSSFKTVSTRQPVDRIRLGLNEVPVFNTSICLNIADKDINFSSVKKNRSAGKGAAAAQSIWDRYTTSIYTASGKFTMHFPFALIGS